MQCTRCKSIVADTAAMCPTCGNALGAVDSYGATSFAPVLPAPQPAAHVSVRNPAAAQKEQHDLGIASTMLSSSPRSGAVPPTMASNSPLAPQIAQQANVPRYVVTPTRGQPLMPTQPVQQMQAPPPTMQSAPMPSPQQNNFGQQGASYGMVPMPSAAMTPGAYGPPQQPQALYGQQPYSYGPPIVNGGPTPPLAVASLVCGLLGWIPFWIGFVLCLLAITFASIVLFNTRPGQSGRGLAVTGLVFGLVLFLPAACGL